MLYAAFGEGRLISQHRSLALRHTVLRVCIADTSLWRGGQQISCYLARHSLLPSTVKTISGYTVQLALQSKHRDSAICRRLIAPIQPPTAVLYSYSDYSQTVVAIEWHQYDTSSGEGVGSCTSLSAPEQKFSNIKIAASSRGVDKGGFTFFQNYNSSNWFFTRQRLN